MPNHVRNILKFTNLKAEDKRYIINNFTSVVEEEGGVYPLDRVFDLDKIIPEPRLESECPDDCKVNKDSHVMEYEDRPWFDWYTWHNKYWGTKWNCYDGYINIGVSTITFVFSTAWSTPYPVYEQLRKAGYKFNVRYADEDYGNNCGTISFDGEHFDWIQEDEIKNPNIFARRVWTY